MGGVASGAATCLIGFNWPISSVNPLPSLNSELCNTQQGFVDLELVVAQDNPAYRHQDAGYQAHGLAAWLAESAVSLATFDNVLLCQCTY